ncbi:hypothetical protein [Acetobacter ghanensis]|uniref:hypothetical protein n=1 Tax=Acetobacter ghanensis TaxID=431306 RepID=UPI000AF9D6FE|nr:hypothetical protein [Acetobacter ghanensis]
MKLNHINLYSHDTGADRAMFEQYFGLRTLVVRGSKMAVLQDNDGLVELPRVLWRRFLSDLSG